MEKKISCSTCHGSGKTTCCFSDCRGTGRIVCSTCRGTGKLRWYREMLRTHKTLLHEDAVDDIPDEELPPISLKDAEGKDILNHCSLNLTPPSGFNEKVDASLLKLDMDATNEVKGNQGKQHQQRLAIRAIRATRVECTMDDKQFFYWVYGDQKLLMIQEDWGYPAQCLCGCSIS